MNETFCKIFKPLWFKGEVANALMFEPCYTFLQKSDSGKEWIDFNMEEVSDVFIIFHRRLGLAATLFNIYGNDRPYFQSKYSNNGRQLSRFIELELE